MTRARDLASGLAGVRPFAMASGVGSNTGAISNGVVSSQTITFPSGRFTSTPIVTVVARESSRAGVYDINTLSTTSVQINVINLSGGVASYTPMWTAVQMTSGSASG
jgi:hypothetical protein